MSVWGFHLLLYPYVSPRLSRDGAHPIHSVEMGGTGGDGGDVCVGVGGGDAGSVSGGD